MINVEQKEIEQIFIKIDKIAKKGSDYYIDYTKLVDELLFSSKFALFKECLNIYYNYDDNNLDVSTLKRETWPIVRFYTNSSFQEQRQKLMKNKGIYQVSLDYYKYVPLTSAIVVDTKGSGCELKPVTQDGGVVSITVIRQGQNYSASASIAISGGIENATATPIIKSGKVTSIVMGTTGSGHNQTIKLGRIKEVDIYNEDVSNTLTKDEYQRIIKNKVTELIVTKEGATFSATFSEWNSTKSYDKNILKLYDSSLNYLLL